MPATTACCCGAAMPAANGAAGDVILGQGDDAGRDHNRGEYWPSARCFNMPYGTARCTATGCSSPTPPTRACCASTARLIARRRGRRWPASRVLPTRATTAGGAATRDCAVLALWRQRGRRAPRSIVDSGNNRVLLWDVPGDPHDRPRLTRDASPRSPDPRARHRAGRRFPADGVAPGTGLRPRRRGANDGEGVLIDAPAARRARLDALRARACKASRRRSRTSSCRRARRLRPAPPPDALSHRAESAPAPCRRRDRARRRDLRGLRRRDRSIPFARRYRYPFTTCTHCGPRLSIVERVPYDRGRTHHGGVRAVRRLRARIRRSRRPPLPRPGHRLPRLRPARAAAARRRRARSASSATSSSTTSTPRHPDRQRRDRRHQGPGRLPARLRRDQRRRGGALARAASGATPSRSR